MVTFPTSPLFLWYETHDSGMRWLANIDRGCSHFSCDVSELVSKWRFSCSLDGHASPSNYDDCRGRNGDHVLSQYYNLLEDMYFWTLSLEPCPTTHHSNTSVGSKQVFGVGMSTLSNMGFTTSPLTFQRWCIFIHFLERWKRNALFRHFYRVHDFIWVVLGVRGIYVN